MIDFSLLPKLIESSGAMNQEQKTFLLTGLPSYDEQKKEELFKILKNEQDKKHDLNERRMAEKTAYESKRSGIVRAYTERKDTESEAGELEALEKELETA